MTSERNVRQKDSPTGASDLSPLAQQALAQNWMTVRSQGLDCAYIQQACSSHLRYGPAELLLMHVQAADPVQIHQLLIAACPE
eukprot:CAMPEP_0173107110 /NCGR_PEP_ID=MMETSP1102-20130122/41551_1 /TAXON_ID=49646 /ORGANISM="Geminigera sp., Strain Caron Lab Isolate" /LENGTH=82 /DNA_ID=CAMNT_0014004575 /DNA_START=1008 /DNA_END=1254 /DNA_ORIENTATION=-